MVACGLVWSLLLAGALFALGMAGGVLIAWISPGWLNRDAVPPGWMLTCLGALGAVLVLGTLVALPATRVVATAGHHAGDASMLGD